jgi:hypothetical protein
MDKYLHRTPIGGASSTKIPTYPNIFFLVFPLFCAGIDRNKLGGISYVDVK